MKYSNGTDESILKPKSNVASEREYKQDITVKWKLALGTK